MAVTYYPATAGSGSISNPSGLDVDTALGIAFIANQNAAGTLSIVEVASKTELAGSPVSVGPDPHGVAADSVAHVAYVANTGTSNVGGAKAAQGGKTVSIVGQQQSEDSAGNWVQLATITAGYEPHGVAVGREMGGGSTSYLFVANQGDNTVSIFDCSEAPASVPVEIAGSPVSLVFQDCPNPNPHGIGADPTLNYVYVACRNPKGANGYVAVLDGGNSWKPGFIAVGNSPTGIGVNSATGMAYVSNNGDNTVTPITGASMTAGTPIRSTSFNGPDRFAVDEANNIIYVSNNTSNTVSAIFGDKDNSVESAGVPGNPPVSSAPTEMGYLNGILYVALQNANQMAEVPAPGAFA